MLWAGFPADSLWAVGVLFGVDLVVTGIAMMLRGRTQRAAARADAATGTGV